MIPLVKSDRSYAALAANQRVAMSPRLHSPFFAAFFTPLLATVMGMVLWCMSPRVWAQAPTAAAPHVHGSPNAEPVASPEPGPKAPLTWQEANRQVSAFPRGHMDLLRWEQKHLAPSPGDEAHPDAGQLTLPRALRLALSDEGEGLKPGMSAMEQAEIRQQAAALRRDVQKLWVDAVASRQSVAHSRDILAVAQAGAELGQRMAAVGNWSRARQIPEELSLWDARARLEKAQLQEQRALHALWQRIGANMSVQALAQQLPLHLPLTNTSTGRHVRADHRATEQTTHRTQAGDFSTGDNIETLQAKALQAHLRWATEDQQARRLMSGVGLNAQELQTARQALGEWAAQERPQWDPRLLRWGHDFERAWQAQRQADRLARQVRADVQSALSAFQLAQQSAQQTQAAVLRLHTELAKETLLRYNGMLKSTWDLLASARTRIDSVDAALQAQRQVWHAHADLVAVLAGLPYPVSASDSAGTPRISTNAAGH